MGSYAQTFNMSVITPRESIGHALERFPYLGMPFSEKRPNVVGFMLADRFSHKRQPAFVVLRRHDQIQPVAERLITDIPGDYLVSLIISYPEDATLEKAVANLIATDQLIHKYDMIEFSCGLRYYTGPMQVFNGIYLTAMK